MDRHKVIFEISGRDKVKIKILDSDKIIHQETLTTGQDFDILLIKTLDKIISKHKMGRPSLKSVEISGKTVSSAISGMILKSVAKALEI